MMFSLSDIYLSVIYRIKEIKRVFISSFDSLKFT
jgi:hypothetical protein